MAMTFLYSIYILTLALLLYMIFLLMRMSGSKAAAAFLCVVFSEIFIILGMLLEVMMGSSVEAALVCLKLQYVGQAVFVMSLLYFCSIYLHVRIRAAVYGIQTVINLIMLVGCLTAEWHTLFYSSMYITYADAPYPTIKVTDGPIWYMHYAHLLLVQFAVMGFAVVRYRQGNSRQKARSRYLLIGLGIEIVELLMKGAGLFGSFNPFVIAAFIFTVCLYVGIFRYGYFDTIEVAMNNALSYSSEGFLVADNDERILFLNRQMRQLFPVLRAGSSIRLSDPVADIFDGKSEIREGDIYYKAVLEDVREGDLSDGKMLRLIDMTDYLKRMDQLRRESELKTDFLSRVSHEIRTPLNTINGMNEMILHESHEPQILSYAGDIREAQETLMSLIGDVLDVTRIEKGSLILEPEEFSLRSLLRRLWRAAELKCRKKGLAITFDIDPSLPAVWYADEARTYQVIENLLSNAVKYTETGSVALTLRRSGKAEISIVVEDTGIGIPQGSEDKIFRRFEQLQTGNRRQGLGLGLEITKTIVEKMNGHIRVISEVGKGSRFTIKIPMTFADEGERIGADWRSVRETRTEYRSFRCEGKRILVVDDNEMNRKVMRNFLKSSGLIIDEAASGEDCLALLSQGRRYDLFFLDHMMPGMDGIELFHAITALPAWQANPVPVIALTANAVKGARQLYLAEGFDDYLAKPIDVRTLFEMLADYLGGDVTTAPKADPAAPAVATQQPERLRRLGMDTETALRYADGSTEFLTEELTLFVKNEPETARAMDAAADIADWNTLAVQVHGLKNNFATLGFTPLAEQAKALELSLRKNGCGDGYADFARRYRNLAEALRRAGFENPEKGDTPS